MASVKSRLFGNIVLIVTAILLYLPPLYESLYITQESPGRVLQYSWLL